jgi:hypothetical protein
MTPQGTTLHAPTSAQQLRADLLRALAAQRGLNHTDKRVLDKLATQNPMPTKADA